jgi:hypothetical protein
MWLSREPIFRRGFLRVSNPQAASFFAALPLSLGVSLRGWRSIDVEERGRKFRLTNTRLEGALPFPFPDIRAIAAGAQVSRTTSTIWLLLSRWTVTTEPSMARLEEIEWPAASRSTTVTRPSGWIVLTTLFFPGSDSLTTI